MSAPDPMPFYAAPFIRNQGKGSNGRRWAMLALPREAWKPISGGCCCRYCAPDTKAAAPAFWDCFTIDLEAVIEGSEDVRVGYCHAPEMHGAPLKREQWR